MSNVHILSTGGTIASTDSEGGAQPNKRGSDLIADLDDTGQSVDLIVEQVAQTPSFDIDFETMASVVRRAEAAVSEGADGIVVTHGTDTMEESAYFSALTTEIDVPIVFTGAQRRPDELSPDGPANLANAIRVVAHDQLQNVGGTYIVFNDEIHTARAVRKMHTSQLHTFQSPGIGPLGTLFRDRIQFHAAPDGSDKLFDPIGPECTVRIIPSCAGMSRNPIDEAVDASVNGIIVEGTGLGNTTAKISEAVADAIDHGIPTIVTSRCPGGVTVPVYGGGGGGKSLLDHGVGFADGLPAHKARIKLALALDQSDDPLSYFRYDHE